MKTLIVGAGAAGMMAAAQMSEHGADVCLVEKNSILGRKVIISGGGRCNITTTNSEIAVLMKQYPRGGRWLRFAMHEFDPEAVYAWFEGRGIPLKIEVRRVFPRSNKGTDVTEMFGRLFE
ncbi:NAD(P)/FAD-dependent oxidoreductase, partial [Candidatus Gracilibacteria bacterium]|nr:NAD(P)/FAD-dependent oxidoreductase [Candidatus Gracilibacteria bacterium]